MTHQTSPFEAMPLELLVNVLSNMSTPEDVLATIKASPAALSAFMTGPERIYSVVLKTCLAPEIFRELLAIVNAPDHNNCPSVAAPQPAEEWCEIRDSVVDEWDAWAHNAYDFLESHARGAVYQIPDPKIDATKFTAQIRFMIHLYFCLSKFVNFYPAFARSNAARTQPGFPSTDGMGQRVQKGQEWPPLSDTELLRLQRGLLRYEMFCRLIGIPSVAASCNRDICDAAITRCHGSFVSEIWVLNPFSEILPMDEFEEIVCASIYVRGLYDSLRWSSVEEFYNDVLSSSQGRGDSVLNRDDSDTTKTAEYWLSQTECQVLDFSSLRRYGMLDWKESMSRLGLVFLNRVTRSTLAERRELMRSAFNRILAPSDDRFLWRYWDDIVNVRCTAEGGSLGLGPHCNSMVQIASSESLVSNLMILDGGDHRLRSLGWVFFDDRTKHRSLGIPHHATVSTMHDWLNEPENRYRSESPPKPKTYDSALAARFTEQEWEELVLGRYSQKDRRSDYQAMSKFVAGARAVVDFTSTQLPQID